MDVARRNGSFVIFILVLVAAIRLAPAQNVNDFRIIVHASNPLNSISSADVARFFMEDNVEWPNGTPAIPVDLTPESPVRADFSSSILGRDVAAVRARWRRLIFKGEGVPPPTRASENEIVQFVAANPGAIGYISRGAASSAGVKVITISN